MSFILDRRAFGYKGLLRNIRSFVSGYPELISTGPEIRQGAPGASPFPPSVGAGEVFIATGPNAQTGRLRATCTVAGGNDVAQFTLAYTGQGSPPAPLSPDFQSPVFPTFSSTLTANQPIEENDIYLVITSSVNWVVGNVVDMDLVPTSNTTPWTERRFFGDAANSPEFSGDIEWFTQGPGAGSPGAFITIGMESRTSGADVRDIRVQGFDAFLDTSPFTPIGSQPNGSPAKRMHLDEQGITYYITINNRRFIVLCELQSGVWESMYCGFFLPYAGVSSYPYPMAIGGSDQDRGVAPSDTDNRHSAWWDPRENSSGVTGPLAVRTPGGAYQAFWNFEGNFTDTSIDNVVFPWGEGNQVASTVFHTNGLDQQARTPRFVLDFSPFTLARAYNFQQSVLFSRDFPGGSQTLGFLDGVFGVTGENNAPGNTFVFESPEVTYLIGRDTFRTGRRGFVALRMDPD